MPRRALPPLGHRAADSGRSRRQLFVDVDSVPSASNSITSSSANVASVVALSEGARSEVAQG